MNEFFVRFSLHRSCRSFEEDQFDIHAIPGLAKGDVDRYICECNSYQEKIAKNLKSRYDLSALSGKRTLFIGDSITTDRLGYRGIVTKAAKLNAVNGSFSGATSTDMARYVYELTQSSSPELISVLIGTNDAVMVGGEPMFNTVSIEEYSRNLGNILDISLASSAKVILMTIPCCNEYAFNSQNASLGRHQDNANISVYNQVVHEMAEKKSIALLNLEKFMNERRTENLHEPDGIHLNIGTHVCLAEEWLKRVSEIIK